MSTENQKQSDVFNELMTDAKAKSLNLPYKEPYINMYGREDFNLRNTHLFSPAAKNKRELGTYVDAKINSAEWSDYLQQEAYRCVEGYSLGSLRITGYHYALLNFAKIKVIVEKLTQDGTVIGEETQDFPNFIKAQYDYFWALQIARSGISPKNLSKLGLSIKINKDSLSGGKHVVVLKSRQIGWSIIAALCVVVDSFLSVLTGSLRKSFVTAGDSKYLTGTDGLMSKIRSNVRYFNTNTNGLFYQPIAVNNKDEIIPGTKDPQTNEIDQSGGIIASRLLKDPDAARGINGYTIYLEEFGSFRDSASVLSIIRPSVEPGGYVTGMIVAYGTGGEMGEGIEGLQDLFYNPKKRNFLSIDNSHLEDGLEDSGLFIPIQEAAFRFLDSDGNPLRQQALDFYTERLKSFENNPKEYQKELAEMPFKPSQAFRQVNNNNFNIDNLIRQEELLAQFGGKSTERVGNLEYIMSGIDIVGQTFKENRNGKVHILELPYSTEEDGVPKNMYIAGIDGIDMGTDSESESTKGSDFCMVVKRRYSPLAEDETTNKYVAYYMDRPRDEEEAFEVALKLAVFYNCEINLERTRSAVRNYFKLNKNLGDQSFRFCAPPLGLSTNLNLKSKSTSFGTQATSKTNEYADNKVKQYIEQYCELIEFPAMLKEALNYNPSKRGKFDLIVAWGMCEILDESYDLEGKHTQVKKKHSQAKYGYYKEQQGGRMVTRFGRIPESNEGLNQDTMSKAAMYELNKYQYRK